MKNNTDCQNLCVNIQSETGKLKRVLLHRPGNELESLTPQYLDSMLFEDIPYLEKMQQEHDNFAKTLKAQGCEVLYVRELLEDLLEQEALRKKIIAYTIEASGIPNVRLRKDIEAVLFEMPINRLTDALLGGLEKGDVVRTAKAHDLSYYIRDDYPYYISPLPNLYFTRDPGTVIGNSLSINTMQTQARRRESFLLSMICSKHSTFADWRKTHPDGLLEGYAEGSSIEGGDILVLDKHTLAVGCSARTEAWAIEELARIIFSKNTNCKRVLVIQIPFTRAYMHLDTVFTMVDYDKFTIYPGVEQSLKVFVMTPRADGELNIDHAPDLKTALKTYLQIPSVDLIQTGGGDRITAAREQWNDSTNTLAVAPGTVVTYKRNVVSNDTLVKHGITVLAIDGSELVRGRGGPRCMSMPLLRDPIC